MLGLDDLAARLVDLLPLLPCTVGVELDPERGREHGRREILGVLARDLLRLAEGVVFGEVAVGVVLAGEGLPDRGGDEPVRFVRLVPCHDTVDDLSCLDLAEPLLARDLLRLGREDRGDVDQVAPLDPGITQRELEGSETVLVHANAPGEEDLCRNNHRGAIRSFRFFSLWCRIASQSPRGLECSRFTAARGEAEEACAGGPARQGIRHPRTRVRRPGE